MLDVLSDEDRMGASPRLLNLNDRVLKTETLPPLSCDPLGLKVRRVGIALE